MPPVMRNSGKVRQEPESLSGFLLFMTGNEDIIHSELHSRWEEVAGYPLSDSDYEEIRDNLSAFFKLLAKWDSESDGDNRGV